MDNVYAVVSCRGQAGFFHGPQGITQAEYTAEMERADSFWSCPVCNQRAEFSDNAWEVLEAQRCGDPVESDDLGGWTQKHIDEAAVNLSRRLR